MLNTEAAASSGARRERGGVRSGAQRLGGLEVAEGVGARGLRSMVSRSGVR